MPRRLKHPTLRASSAGLAATLLWAGLAAAEPAPVPAATPATAEAAGAPVTPVATSPVTADLAAPAAVPGPTTAVTETDAEGKFAAASDTSSDSFTTDESSGDSDTQRKLDLYGFADFTYQRLLIPKDNIWTRTYPSVNSFAVGNFNLYLSSNLGDSWRALAEVRFLYLPNGATTTDPATGNANRTDTTVLDYAGFEEPIRWGGIRIERIYVEHEFNGLLKLQVGQFLTPYGIWNVDHGSPTIIGIKKPFVVAAQLFPEQQTGLQLYGSGFLDPFEIGYHLTLSNGRGPVEYQDFDDDKAFGGRVYGKTDSLGTLTVGASFYRGGYYDRSAKYGLTADGLGVDQTYTTISKYREMSLGADVKWEYKSWLAQGEFLMNETNFDTGARPRHQVVKPPQGYQPDYRRWGAYGLLGYRLSFLPLMPYVIVQHAYAPDSPNTPPATAYEVGVNYRPTAAVVVKLEYTDWHFSEPGAAGFGRYPLRILASQVAWAF
ncbi:MAG: hypothetical protein ABW061_01640 [Polyangiaceae bacterium]